MTGPRGFWGAAPTRLFVFFVVLVLAYAAGQLSLMTIAGRAPPPARSWLVVAALAPLAATVLALYVGLVRLFERRAASELAARPGGALAAGGLLLGAALFFAVYLVLCAQGVARFEGLNPSRDVSLPFALAVLAGVGEEVIFRGVVFRIVEESCGTLAALAISAGFFGFVHLTAPHATATSATAIAVEAGVLLGAAYLVSRNLWFPIGLHAGWNLVEGCVFGSAVSGRTVAGLVRAPLAGPASITGGAFGPEASPAAVAVCLAAAAALLVLAARRGHWRAFRLRLYPRSAAAGR